MTNSRALLFSLMAACLLALVAQMVIDFSTVNLAATCLVFSASVAMLLYLLWTPSIHTHPLSTFTLLGFCVTNLMGALLGQTLLWTSLSQNLRQPLETFATLAAFQSVAMIAHTLYRLALNPAAGQREADRQSSLPRQILERLGVYDVPGTTALWIVGYVGFLAFLLGSGRAGAFGKLMHATGYLTWAPFLIPMYILQFGDAYSRLRDQIIHLTWYALLIVLLGLAANTRGVMLSGFMTVGLFALLMTLRSQQPVSGRRLLRLGALGLVLSALVAPLSDLATAMVVARGARENVSAPQLVQLTWRAFTQPEALENERERVREATSAKYDEFYFDNPLLARLTETKFHDNALYFASTLTQSDVDALADTTGKMLLFILPQPVLDQLDIHIDKLDYEFSMGDYLSHLSQGGPLGSRRTGSMLAQGLALMGVGFFIPFALFCLVIFALLDLLTARGRSGHLVVSAVGLLSVWKLFQYGISAESLNAWIGFAVRLWPQNLVLFLGVALLARIPIAMLGGRAFRSLAELSSAKP